MILNKNYDYIGQLTHLIKFKKVLLEIIEIDEIKIKPKEFEEFKIVISSNRLDNFVSELARCSRTKANEIIEEGRVLVNNINELKFSKKINVGDVITIRGKGKFIYDGEENKTRSDRIVVNIRKYK